MKKIKDKLEERSTFFGLGAILGGLAGILDWDEGRVISETVTQNADQLASGDYMGPGVALALGLAALFKNDKKKAR